MSNRNKKCLEMQAKRVFERLKCFGQSKDAVKKVAADEWKRLNLAAEGITKRDYVNDALRDKIFSVNTYKDYAEKNNRFFNYVRAKGYPCETLKDIKQYIPEYLQSHIDKGNSAWTIKACAAALGKLYQCPGKDFLQGLNVERRREDITRSRNVAKRDYGFSLKNNAEIINFCRSVGFRSNRELAQLRGDQLHFTKDGQPYISLYGKGGKYREVPIIGRYKADVVARMQQAGSNKVWQRIPSHMDVHGYRADYAAALYHAVARPIEQIPYDSINKGTGLPFQSDVYRCRGDRKGIFLDKKAMLIVSKALGHSRISVIAQSYLWGV